ncbi:hypothetical protein JCM5353_002452 [Sporobolomyces roseus]
MSIRDLPHEVLNLVFSQIHDKTSPPTAESQATFSSLCLTSKSLLPLAREYLYYRPVRSRTNVLAWESSLGLLLVLQEPRSPLTQLVRSLEDLINILDQLEYFALDLDLDETELPLIAEYSGSYDFLLRLLEICSNLQTLELALGSSDQLANFTRSLRVSTPTIKTLHLRESRQLAAQEALDHPLFQHVETLVVTEIDPPANWRAVFPRTRLPLKSLQFNRCLLENDLLEPFIPEDPSSLVDFTLSFAKEHTSDLEIIATLNLLPTTLHRLAIACHVNESPVTRPSVAACYTNQHYPEIPLDPLSRFTSLRTLILERFQGPSLSLLKLLATSSPSLQKLDFSYSHWIPPARTSLLTPESIFPLTEIFDVLCTFQNLRYIHFGYLPTSRREDHEGWICKLRERGVAVHWEACQPKDWLP